MADEKNKPRGVNKASDKKRFITLSINTKLINKDLLIFGEKGGVYLNCVLHMLPNGEVDRFDNLGMITQSVPPEIYKKTKDLPKDQQPKGEILGNAKELVWDAGEPEKTKTADQMSKDEINEIMDDLPF